MTTEEIVLAIAESRIKAVTLDTSIFDSNGRHLERGLLQKLDQFKRAHSKFILSDVVVHEVLKHLTKDAENAQSQVKKARRMVQDSWGADEARAAEVAEESIATRSAESMAQHRWSEFIKSCDIELISSKEYCDAGQLVSRYFDVKPPFEERPDKKREFPDALALLSLEAWSRENECMTLVVTRDKGWMAFCDSSEQLVATDDLGGALASFHSHDPAQFVARLIDNIESSDPDPHGLCTATEHAIREQADRIEIDLLADSHLFVEQDEVELEVKEGSVSLVGRSVELVDIDENHAVIHLPVSVVVSITGIFSFSKWDSIDREYISFGSGSAAVEETLELYVLATLVGNSLNGVEIDEIELLPYRGLVDVGEVEPDWMNDPDNFE